MDLYSVYRQTFGTATLPLRRRLRLWRWLYKSWSSDFQTRWSRCVCRSLPVVSMAHAQYPLRRRWCLHRLSTSCHCPQLLDSYSTSYLSSTLVSTNAGNNRFESIRTAESIRIDSLWRIKWVGFDSVQSRNLLNCPSLCLVCIPLHVRSRFLIFAKKFRVY